MTKNLAFLGGVLGIMLSGCGGGPPQLDVIPNQAEMYPGYKGGSSRTGYTDSNESTKLSLLWQIKFRSPLFFEPSMVGDYVFQPGTDKKIHVLNINTGVEIAEIKLRRHIGTTPEISGPYMAICEEGEKSELLVINYVNGELIWSASTYRACFQPVLYNNKIFWADGRNSIHAAWLIDGEKLWSKNVDGGFDVGPIVCNDRLYITSRDSTIYCLDPENGETIWRTPGLGRTNSSPACFETELYICNADGTIAGYNAITGELLWQYEDHSRLFYSPSVDECGVYYGSGDGLFIKLDRLTGQKLWEYKTGSPVRGTALINSQNVIFASLDYTVYILDKTSGLPLTSFIAGGMISAAPVLFDNKLFIAAQDKFLNCFSLKGKE
ncbi:MAG: PQQ-binding-like beta-propeller repeat protein [candidate division Zixibacteria bacterium]|nr:PQQ-binding-like beta-propeller repeat protein [candidate division Zixibacteria bacterium]